MISDRGLAFLLGMLTAAVLALVGMLCVLGIGRAERRIVNLDRGPR